MNTLVAILVALCDEVRTPVADAVKRHALAGEWKELLELRCDPRDYDDPEKFWADAQCIDFTRKLQVEIPGVDRKRKAVDTFWACEAQCASTNVRLARYMPEDPLIEDMQDLAVLSFIEEVRKEVSLTLGKLPTDLRARFGPGSTISDKGLYTTVPDKMSSRPTVYPEARCLLPLWEPTAWARAISTGRPWNSVPEEVRYNRFTTVPKDGLKDRGICIEASIPIYFQLGLGSCLKRKLKDGPMKIDLAQGQAYHNALACVGSLSGDISTIDLSNASDTVARVLIPLLVRDKGWVALLESLRAPSTLIDGKIVRLEKFSSMGNGFTFELETLLYAALVRSVVKLEGGNPSLVSVYGDDIIVPTVHSKSVLGCLKFFGFTPNERKTFTEGPFRESCGGDFFSGVQVNTFKLEDFNDEPQERITIANGLRRVASDSAGTLLPHRWRLVRSAWVVALRGLPRDILRCRGPRNLGDIVIHDHEDQWSIDAKATMRLKINGLSGYVIRVYSPVSELVELKHFAPEVVYASALYGVDSEGVTPRGAISGYHLTSVHWVPFEGLDDSLWFEYTDKLRLAMVRRGSPPRTQQGQNVCYITSSYE